MHADFGDYYRWHYPRLVGFLLVLGASVPEATEVAQQAMNELFRHWDQVTNRRAWTCGSAMRLVQQRDRRAGLESARVPATDASAWPAEHEIIGRISGLPPRQRQIIAWKLMEFAAGEIAAELHLSPEAVRADLAEARKALRPYLMAARSGR